MKLKQTLSIIAIAAFITPLALSAQQAPQQMQQAPQTEVTQEQLADFAKAQRAVEKVSAKHQAALTEASTPEEAQEVQAKAQRDAVKAIEDTGMSVEQYSQIAQAVNQNPELRQQMGR